MNTILKVESAIERSNGKAGGVGNERFEVRFWLSTEVNGRKVESRGEVISVEKPTVEEARRWMRQITYTINGAIANNMWTAKDARLVNGELPKLVAEAIEEEIQFRADFGIE